MKVDCVIKPRELTKWESNTDVLDVDWVAAYIQQYTFSQIVFHYSNYAQLVAAWNMKMHQQR